MRGVHHLGVILHACQSARPVLEPRDRRARAAGHHLEALRRGGDGVAVAHPHRLGSGQIRMKLSPTDVQLGATVLTGPGAGHGAAEGLCHRLESVADAEHRNPEVEQRGVQLRGALGVHAGRAAGQHDGLRVLGLDLLDGGAVWNDLRVHPRLADAPRDQLRVLRPEVDHQHGARGCRMHLLSLRAGATDASHRRRSTEMPSSLTAIARMNVSLSKPESRCSRSNSCSSSCSFAGQAGSPGWCRRRSRARRTRLGEAAP